MASHFWQRILSNQIKTMNKTFKTIFYLIAVSLALSPPVYAKMSLAQLQQKLVDQLSADEQSSSVEKAVPDDDSQSSTDSKKSANKPDNKKGSDSHQSSQNTEKANLAALSLGDGEEVAPTMPDYTKRGYTNAGNNVSVSAWNGLATVDIPLVHVSGNDGISLNVIYAYDDYSIRAVFKNTINRAVFHGDLVPGLVGESSSGGSSAFYFRDNSGNVHILYYVSSGHYESRDHWKATTSGSKYTVFAPSGETYIGNGTHISKLVSAHGTDAVSYAWSNNDKIVTMTLQSTGYKVTWNKDSRILSQTNGHSIQGNRMSGFRSHFYMLTDLETN